ncbi:cyclin-dependent kinase 4 inhibitor C-like [Diadema antillarum]|uniref:cyclin-dependent kinase 4 inhibitor C-like n=1 Tax=Diadema antillarum TaxID=105358 RepID=UPI003A85801E
MAAQNEPDFVNKITQAAARGDTKIDELQALLETAPNDTVNSFNKYGRTAIQVMNMMRPDITRLLLEWKADPNVPDPDVGRTPLHDAVEQGYLETVSLLLDHGANALAQDNWGNTPAHIAAETGNSDRIKQVLELLHRTATLTEVNHNGQTPLDVAMTNGHQDIVLFLQQLRRRVPSLQFLARRIIRRRIPPVRMDELRPVVPKVVIDFLKNR